MDILTSTDYTKILQKAILLKGSTNAPKLLLTQDNRIVKFLPNSKKLFSFSRFFPYAKRFYRNFSKLLKLGIPTISDLKLFFYKPLECYVLIYPKIEGITARAFLNKDKSIASKIAEFIALLHAKGVFFQDLHLDNIIIQPNLKCALIDIHSLKFHKTALSFRKRIRSLRRLLVFESEDNPKINKSVVHKLLDSYYKQAQFSNYFIEKFENALRKDLSRKNINNLI